MHSRFSDGSDTPESLIRNVREAGIDLFSLTDHDCYEGCGKVTELLTDRDPAFLAGIEFSCRDANGKYHVLGYGYDIGKDSIRDAVDITHNARMHKVFGRIEWMEQTYGFHFKEEDLDALRAMKNPGKPHIAKIMVKCGYAKDVHHAFDLMEDYHGGERYLSPLEAIDAIFQADGIPVLAHGIFGDGSQNLSEEEVERRVAMMKDCGLMGLECYYSGFSRAQTEFMLTLADKYNLFVTAGSDYHGSNKTVKLGDTGTQPDPDRMRRFYRTLLLMEKTTL